jgi:hypothetical protein
MNGNKNRGCGTGALPSCNVRGYTNLLPEVPQECAAYANQSGKELCVTHAGGINLNQANTGLIAVTIDPQFSTAYWAQLMSICIFETGTQTVVNNAEIANIMIRGSSQFASQNVPICGWNVAMPFLGVAFDMADSTNPIDLTFNVRSAGNVDVLVFTAGYGIR